MGLTAETNLITTEDFKNKAKIRETDFAFRFNYSVSKLVEALGITRKIPKVAGTVIKGYKATGTLVTEQVGEGEIIPLSKYTVEPVTFKEITLKKYRKATSAENIIKYGFDQAVNMTTEEMLHDVQRGIRKDFFDFFKNESGVVANNGKTLQKVLASAMGKLLALFDTDSVEAVHFVNPITVYEYLGDKEITTQTAFGMTYVKDFLGYGTLIMNNSVPEGKVYSTVADNLVLYYIPVNGADLGEAFNFTTDETGYIGIHETADYDNLTDKETVVDGIALFAENISGVLAGEISGVSAGEDSGE